MGRRTVEVHQATLRECIVQAEAKGPLSNLNALWAKVSDLYNLREVPEQITPSVAMLRVKEWNITVKTQPGKRGRSGAMTAEQKAAMAAGRKPRAEKFKDDPVIQAGFVQLRREINPRFSTLLDKLTEQGSMRAAVALKCLDCSNEQTVEVRNCPCTSCPLYAFRPYQNKADTDEEELQEAA
jgi:hypothetical protein